MPNRCPPESPPTLAAGERTLTFRYGAATRPKSGRAPTYHLEFLYSFIGEDNRPACPGQKKSFTGTNACATDQSLVSLPSERSSSWPAGHVDLGTSRPLRECAGPFVAR